MGCRHSSRPGRSQLSCRSICPLLLASRYNGAVSTPTEIKAQAIALLILGRSCREAQAELREQFPEAEIHHYSTIARWFQKMATPKTKGAAAYWAVLAHLTADMVDSRMDELNKMSLMEVVEFSSRATDIYYSLRERSAALDHRRCCTARI